MLEVCVDDCHDGRRVFAVTIEGERYWVKRSLKNYRNLFQVVLYPNFSALRDEARAMLGLRRRAMLVPTVVHETADFVVLTDVGECLYDCLLQGDEEQRMRYVLQVADLLGELHQRKGWHGNAALRNFTLRNGQLGMIDFENTAHRWCTLNLRQAFDLWQVLNSIANFPERKSLAKAFLARYRPTSRALFDLRVMAWGLSPFYLMLVPFGAHLTPDIRNGVNSVGTLLVL